MNWSPPVVGEVPPAEVAVTSTVPAVPGGDTAVIDVEELMVMLAAVVDPNLIAVEALKLVPVMVTVVPPLPGPLVGLMPVTDGV